MSIAIIILTSLAILLLNMEIFAQESTAVSSSSSLESRMAEIEIIEVTAHKPLLPSSQIDTDTEVSAIIEESNLELSNSPKKEDAD